jgi:hypothetical protein
MTRSFIAALYRNGCIGLDAAAERLCRLRIFTDRVAARMYLLASAIREI